MDKYVKNIIEEKFTSKSQQRFFFAKAGDKDLSKKERKKWGKLAKEFSDDTNYDKLPDSVETDVEEIVDVNGNIARSKVPLTRASKGSTHKTSDEVVKASSGQMGNHGLGRSALTSLRYWAESDMSDALGYDKTLGDDATYDEAFEHFTKKLGLGDEESKERLEALGYIPGEKDLVRLVENPKKYISDYVESVLSKKSSSEDLITKDQTEDVDKEIGPIIKKQIKSLKNTLVKNNLSIKDVLKLLNKDDE
jgi:hypothetical protein